MSGRGPMVVLLGSDTLIFFIGWRGVRRKTTFNILAI